MQDGEFIVILKEILIDHILMELGQDLVWEMNNMFMIILKIDGANLLLYYIWMKVLKVVIPHSLYQEKMKDHLKLNLYNPELEQFYVFLMVKLMKVWFMKAVQFFKGANILLEQMFCIKNDTYYKKFFNFCNIFNNYKVKYFIINI